MYRVILKKTDFQQILLPYFLFYSLASLPGKNSCTKSYSFWQQIFCGSGTSSNPVNTGKHLHETCMYLSYSYMYAFWLKYLSQLREVQILRQFIRYMLHFLIFKYTCSMWSKCQWAKFIQRRNNLLYKTTNFLCLSFKKKNLTQTEICSINGKRMQHIYSTYFILSRKCIQS